MTKMLYKILKVNYSYIILREFKNPAHRFEKLDLFFPLLLRIDSNNISLLVKLTIILSHRDIE